MRWYVIRTLVRKECYRLLANKGGITLFLLLIVASMLTSFFGRRQGAAATITAGIETCYIEYARDDELVQHLRCHVADDLCGQIQFRHFNQVARDANGTLVYPNNAGAIQLRPRP